MKSYVALLYSIVLGPGRRVVMADLRAVAETLGYRDPVTIGASGNLLFRAGEAPLAQIEAELEAGFASRYGKTVDIILRDAEAWRRLAAGNPFPEAAARDGARVHVRVMRHPAGASDLARLSAYAIGGEELRIVEGDLWMHFADRLPSEGKLLGQLTAKRSGVGTVRNWNTVARIAAALEGGG
ncbi:DUF1697 domain-containing protein [Kaistia geumhonensis]|uniref:Uncharacterized protein (DUF1697 family) n=1 Tax=Kaistia geumhonensis TaxID=410839 RepID=A0ABU0M4M3_9HYPH|nr:DUF1697 domain-containing protein [Kaistia geumhonensis]MCX5478990.1 DUF1697 domain-containing protein [Kaistia geumhonensis]MDQ0515790.1 uncharacterized protein (DUF1697 family) [Kaistia geumhonensis]